MKLKKLLSYLKKPSWFWLLEFSLLLWLLFRMESLHLLFIKLTSAMGDAFDIIQFLIDQIVILLKGKGA